MTQEKSAAMIRRRSPVQNKDSSARRPRVFFGSSHSENHFQRRDEEVFFAEKREIVSSSSPSSHPSSTPPSTPQNAAGIPNGTHRNGILRKTPSQEALLSPKSILRNSTSSQAANNRAATASPAISRAANASPANLRKQLSQEIIDAAGSVHAATRTSVQFNQYERDSRDSPRQHRRETTQQQKSVVLTVSTGAGLPRTDPSTLRREGRGGGETPLRMADRQVIGGFYRQRSQSIDDLDSVGRSERSERSEVVRSKTPSPEEIRRQTRTPVSSISSIPPPPPPPPPSHTPKKIMVAEQQNRGSEPNWAGTKLAGRVIDSKTPAIKSIWEENIRKEEIERQESLKQQRPKSYGFPKWRSTDALSASLVASNNVEIPQDSRIPEHRIKKMVETEKEANTNKLLIQQQAGPPKRLHKGKSLDSLSMQVDHKEWFNPTRIRDSISRESIADIGTTRDRFEKRALSPVESTLSRQQHSRTPTLQAVHISQPLHSHGSVAAAHNYPPPPPPPLHHNLQQHAHNRQASNGYTLPPSADFGSQSQLSQPPVGYVQPYGHGYTQGYGPFTPQHSLDYSPSLTSTCPFTEMEQMLMMWCRQNGDVVQGLGIQIPSEIRAATEELPWRRVEMRTVEEDMSQFSPSSSSRPGRYVKRTAQPQQRMRRHEPARQPENRKDPPRQGESLIAAEIRASREREEELRRSRSELGLPTLEDTMHAWRRGMRAGGVGAAQMRAAVSYDQLSQMDLPMQKTVSSEHLSQDPYYDGTARRNSQAFNGYKLHNTEDQDVMIYGPPGGRQRHVSGGAAAIAHHRRFE